MTLPFTPRFCAHCGGRLAAPATPRPGGAPWQCTACGRPVYEDPKVAAAVIIEHDGGVVLLRRAQRDMAHGRWILPGGHVDRWEVVEDAARREAREETGLEVELTDLLGVYSYDDWAWVLVVHTAAAAGGALRPGREALDLAVFTPEAIPWPDLGFRSTRDALRDWLKRRELANRPLA